MHCFPSLRRAHPRACSGASRRDATPRVTRNGMQSCEDRRSNRSRRSCRRTHNHTTITMSSESDEQAVSVTYTIEWRCGDAVSFAQRRVASGCAHSHCRESGVSVRATRPYMLICHQLYHRLPMPLARSCCLTRAFSAYSHGAQVGQVIHVGVLSCIYMMTSPSALHC